mmetsp:Transcript_37575/g.27702  ORF Transcript_37575/g.27702 Transcript_37575/m.27702 type:complete len:87 (+) Transcript_37575:148-408(+)
MVSLKFFSSSVASLVLINVMLSSIVYDPLMNYYIHKYVSKPEAGESPRKDLNLTSSNGELESHSCFKQCILNLHFYTLSVWLIQTN